MLSSGCDMAIALMNSWQLEFPARDLQRGLGLLMFGPGQRKELTGSTLPQGSRDN